MNGRSLLVGSTWVLASLLGFACLWSYSATPGPQASAPGHWPTESHIQRCQDQPTLVMLAHRHCPCTRASLRELERLMAQCAGRLAAKIVLYEPDGASAGHASTDLWSTAAAMENVEVHRDRDGHEVQRFGSITSGHVVLFDREGRLVFTGGITPARGHSGSNHGRSSIVEFVHEGSIERTTTPVFGCSIRDHTALAQLSQLGSIQ